MIKRVTIMLLVVGVIMGGIFGFLAFKNRMIASAIANLKAPPQTVSTTKATSSSWQQAQETTGSFLAVEGASMAAQVSGIVQSIAFVDGQDVKAGTLLVQLNADPQIATLQQYKVSADNAEVTYKRDLRQLKAQGVSQATVDNDLATWKGAQAQVVAQQATIDQYSIKAPFDGRLGTRQVDLGEYLAAGTTVVTLQSLDPIWLDFTMPQQAFSRLEVGQEVTAMVDTYPGQSFTGKITAISPLVDSQSRSLSIRASFANPGGRLLPGMFAKVSVTVGAPRNYITLPQTAVTINPYGNIAFIVTDKGNGPDGKPQLIANQTFVTTGPTRGDQIAVTDGLKEGQTVVTSGQLKLVNGSVVVINNSVQPADDASAAPADSN